MMRSRGVMVGVVVVLALACSRPQAVLTTYNAPTAPPPAAGHLRIVPKAEERTEDALHWQAQIRGDRAWHKIASNAEGGDVVLRLTGGVREDDPAIGIGPCGAFDVDVWVRISQRDADLMMLKVDAKLKGVPHSRSVPASTSRSEEVRVGSAVEAGLGPIAVRAAALKDIVRATLSREENPTLPSHTFLLQLEYDDREGHPQTYNLILAAEE